jgi:hypothetical protein
VIKSSRRDVRQGFDRKRDFFFKPSLSWSPFCSKALAVPLEKSFHNKDAKKRPGEQEQTE